MEKSEIGNRKSRNRTIPASQTRNLETFHWTVHSPIRILGISGLRCRNRAISRFPILNRGDPTFHILVKPKNAEQSTLTGNVHSGVLKSIHGSRVLESVHPECDCSGRRDAGCRSEQ